ncbi:MAG: urea ABC transporter ATP-binding subunit UrtE [Pseudomonadota bacterium]|nr:urea ABC transporter ATP-binding subunit UrtE [Pseudomonadota bacterium]
MLQIRDLNQYYDQSHILWDLSLTAEAGQCTCVMGRNGVGKTSLLKAIMGLVPVRSGEVLFEGESLIGKSAEYRARAGIGYVPQGRMIFPQLSVQENLLVPLGAGRAKKIPDLVWALFPVLREMLHRRGGDLSGGQQQQLAIGRALVLDPKLLILDEPTEGIQPNIVDQIGEVITELKQNFGMGVLLVEQKLAFARKVADRFCIVERGANVDPAISTELTDELVQRHLAV